MLRSKGLIGLFLLVVFSSIIRTDSKERTSLGLLIAFSPKSKAPKIQLGCESTPLEEI